MAGRHGRYSRVTYRRRPWTLLPLVVIVLASGCTPGPEPTPSPASCPESADVPDFPLSKAQTLVGSDVLVCGPHDDVPTSLKLTADWARLLASDGINLPSRIELVDGEGEWTCDLASGSSFVLVNKEWHAARPVECSQAL